MMKWFLITFLLLTAFILILRRRKKQKNSSKWDEHATIVDLRFEEAYQEKNEGLYHIAVIFSDGFQFDFTPDTLTPATREQAVWDAISAHQAAVAQNNKVNPHHHEECSSSPKSRKAVRLVAWVVCVVAIAVTVVAVDNNRTQRAMDAYRAGNYAKAVELLRPGKDIWKEANLKAGEVAYQQKDYASAMGYFEKAKELAYSQHVQAQCDFLLEQIGNKSYCEIWEDLDALLELKIHQMYVSDAQVTLWERMLQDKQLPADDRESQFLDCVLAFVQSPNINNSSRGKQIHIICDFAIEKVAIENFRETWKSLDVLLDLDCEREYVYQACGKLFNVLLQNETLSTSEIESMLESIPNADTDGYAGLHYLAGNYYANSGDFKTALEHYYVNSEYSGTYSAPISKALVGISQKDYEKAAYAYVESAKDLPEDVREDLQWHLISKMDSIKTRELDWILRLQPIYWMINNTQQRWEETAKVDILEALQETLDHYSFSISSQKNTRDSYSCTLTTLTVTDLEDIVKQCGTEPTGKILVVRAERVYGADIYNYQILFSLMNCLPEKYYPMSLKEVEYIICITSNYYKDGTFEKNVPSIRITAIAEARKMPQNKVAYKSQKKSGTPSPSVYYYHGNDLPQFIAGGAPVMTKEIINLFSRILK